MSRLYLHCQSSATRPEKISKKARISIDDAPKRAKVSEVGERCESARSEVQVVVYTSFADLLNRHPLARIKTQIAVAGDLGICSTYISEMKRHGIVPGRPLLNRMADYFGMEPEDLRRLILVSKPLSSPRRHPPRGVPPGMPGNQRRRGPSFRNEWRRAGAATRASERSSPAAPETSTGQEV
jgi:hypothetical protein